MLVQVPTRVPGPLVYGDYGEGPDWYQETMIIEYDPISGLGSPFKFKKVLKKVGHVVGGALRIAAPLMGLIPGIGIPLAGAATLAGKMLQRDKPFQVFKQKSTLFQVGGAMLAASAVGGIARASGFMQTAGAVVKAVPTAEILRGQSGYEQVPIGASGAEFGDVLGVVGRTAIAGITAATQLAPVIAPLIAGAPEAPYQPPYGQPLYLPGAVESQVPQFPGAEYGEHGVRSPTGGGAEYEGEIAAAAAGFPIPLLLIGGAVLFLLMPSPRR